jgi:hypothetical protein
VDVDTRGRTVAVRVRVESEDDLAGFGRVRIDFGDGSAHRAGLVGEYRVEHAYRAAGSYRVVVYVELRDGERAEGRTVIVTEEE